MQELLFIPARKKAQSAGHLCAISFLFFLRFVQLIYKYCTLIYIYASTDNRDGLLCVLLVGTWYISNHFDDRVCSYGEGVV